MFGHAQRDKRQVLTRERCDEILNKATSGVLSVLDADGYPYGVPMSFAYKDDKLYFHCMPGKGHKWEAMKQHDKVSFTIIETDNIVADEYTSYFRSVICFGKVRFVEDEAEKFELHDILVDKYSPEFKEGVYEMFEKRIRWMGAFVVELEHVSGKEAIELAEYLRDLGYMPEQVQDFYPTPSTMSTVMYYTGIDPRDGKEVYVCRNPHEKAMQRALIQYRNPKNYELVKEALLREGRMDLIGFDKKCLIRPRESAQNKSEWSEHRNKSNEKRRSMNGRNMSGQNGKVKVKKKTIRNVHKKK